MGSPAGRFARLVHAPRCRSSSKVRHRHSERERHLCTAVSCRLRYNLARCAAGKIAVFWSTTEVLPLCARMHARTLAALKLASVVAPLPMPRSLILSRRPCPTSARWPTSQRTAIVGENARVKLARCCRWRAGVDSTAADRVPRVSQRCGGWCHPHLRSWRSSPLLTAVSPLRSSCRRVLSAAHLPSFAMLELAADASSGEAQAQAQASHLSNVGSESQGHEQVQHVAKQTSGP